MELMASFAKSSDGLNIAYEVVGDGEPIVLIHGFASDRLQNWRGPLWIDALSNVGFRVVALDCRGHGQSDKPYEPARYTNDLMADDVLVVMDAENIGAANVMGYSMGGMIGIHFALRHAGRVRKLVVGGVGAHYLVDRSADPRIAETAEALETPDKSTISSPVARAFREFADQAGKDRRALAACMRGKRPKRPPQELARVACPVLVVCGEKDDLSGPPEPLASAFGNGRAVVVPRRDHMLTVGDKVYKEAVLEFLAS
jgi:pimeloyl-ACP methyl ester carboxylesterase